MDQFKGVGRILLKSHFLMTKRELKSTCFKKLMVHRRTLSRKKRKRIQTNQNTIKYIIKQCKINK